MTNSPFKLNTNIPLWSLITVLVGGIIAFTTISAQTATNSKNITDLQLSQIKISDTLTDLKVGQGQTQSAIAAQANDITFIKNRLK